MGNLDERSVLEDLTKVYPGKESEVIALYMKYRGTLPGKTVFGGIPYNNLPPSIQLLIAVCETMFDIRDERNFDLYKQPEPPPPYGGWGKRMADTR